MLLTGRQPFSSPKTEDPMVVMRRIVDDTFTIKFPPYVSPAAKDFVLRLLERKPTRRLGMLQASGRAVLVGKGRGVLCKGAGGRGLRRGCEQTSTPCGAGIHKCSPSHSLTCLPPPPLLLAASILPPQGKARDVKQHRWFEGFDWEALAARKVAAPRRPRDDAAKRIRELAVSLWSLAGLHGLVTRPAT